MKNRASGAEDTIAPKSPESRQDVDSPYWGHIRREWEKSLTDLDNQMGLSIIERRIEICTDIINGMSSDKVRRKHCPQIIPTALGLEMFDAFLARHPELSATPQQARRILQVSRQRREEIKSALPRLAARVRELEKLFDLWPDRGVPDWSRRRELIERRANFRCESCGKSQADDPERQFHCHHVVPISQGGDHSPSNLQWLCEKCHREQPGAGHKRIRAKIGAAHKPKTLDQPILRDPPRLAAKRALELLRLLHLSGEAHFINEHYCGPESLHIPPYLEEPDGTSTYRNVHLHFLRGLPAKRSKLRTDGVKLWCGDIEIARHIEGKKVRVVTPWELGITEINPRKETKREAIMRLADAFAELDRS